MSKEILMVVDSVSNEKGVPKETLFEAVELALAVATRKRYGETFDRVGSIELFLKWNVEDPVSAFEVQRNNVIEGAQGNRNPFIDNPYLATLIWGGTPAENKWN